MRPVASTKENQSVMWRAPPSTLPAESTAPSRSRFSHGTRGNAKLRPQLGPCSSCHKFGHLGRDCTRDRGSVPKGTPINSVSCPYATSPRIHIAALVNGKPVRCLVDSGCERTVIGRKLVPNAKLTPSRYVLTAVNKTDLPILGDTILTFEVDGHKFRANVSVSDQVDDFLLGSDFLSARQANGTSRPAHSL